MHSPELADEVTEGRRLGGHRRRKEVVVAGAYELEPLGTSDGLLRLLEIAAVEALSIEGATARVRALVSIVRVGILLSDRSEVATRLEALEAALRSRDRRGERS